MIQLSVSRALGNMYSTSNTGMSAVAHLNNNWTTVSVYCVRWRFEKSTRGVSWRKKCIMIIICILSSSASIRAPFHVDINVMLREQPLATCSSSKLSFVLAGILLLDSWPAPIVSHSSACWIHPAIPNRIFPVSFSVNAFSSENPRSMYACLQSWSITLFTCLEPYSAQQGTALNATCQSLLLD